VKYDIDTMSAMVCENIYAASVYHDQKLKNKSKLEDMKMEYTLQIGEEAKIRKKVFTKSWSVVYAGMPNDSTYSLAVTWSLNYHATAYNLFIAKEIRELPFLNGWLVIKSVSASEIRIEYSG
jgi:hypothetical protein